MMHQENVYQPSFSPAPVSEEYIISPANKTLLVAVYREPNENAELLKRLPADTTVAMIARVESWLFVRIAPGEHGFIRASDARPLRAPEADTSMVSLSDGELPQPSPMPYVVSPSVLSQSVSVFSEPSLNVPVIGNLDAGARIEVISQNASWLYIQYTPEQRGYIVAGNARPATTEELNDRIAISAPVVRSTSNLPQVSASAASWPIVKPPSPLITLPLHYVTRSSLGTTVPVFREPDSSTQAFARLEPGTEIKVIWKSVLWLCIQRAPGEYGYIRQADARPLGASSRTGSSTSSANSNNSKAKARPWFRSTWTSLIMGIACFIIAAIVASIEEQTCVFIFCQTVHPFTQDAQILNVLGFISLGFSFICLIAALIIRASP